MNKAKIKRYEQLLGDPNIQRMLNAIGAAESSNQYNVRYNGEREGEVFDLSQPGSGYRGHPGKRRMTDGQLHSDAGRYQIIEDTWQRAANDLGLTDFNDPHQQDLAALYLLDKRKGKGGLSALELAQQGDFTNAAHAARKEWASIGNRGAGTFVNQFVNNQQPIVPFGQVTPRSQLLAMQNAAPSQPPAVAPTQAPGDAIPAQPVPPENPYLRQVNEPTEQAGSESFGTAMREYYADPQRAVENRTIPGTRESLGVNPFRRFAEAIGLMDAPQPVNNSPEVFSQAAMEGFSFEDWEDRMRQTMGAPALDRQPGAPETYYPALYRQGRQLGLPSAGDFPRQAALPTTPSAAPSTPQLPAAQMKQLFYGAMDKQQQDANNAIFGSIGAPPSVTWPPEVHRAVDGVLNKYTG